MHLDSVVSEIRSPSRSGWKTGEIGLRLGANRSQVGHLARIRNTA
jgi:hypothetical protein